MGLGDTITSWFKPKNPRGEGQQYNLDGTPVDDEGTTILGTTQQQSDALTEKIMNTPGALGPASVDTGTIGNTDDAPVKLGQASPAAAPTSAAPAATPAIPKPPTLMNGKYERGKYGIDKSGSVPTLYGSSAVPLTDAQRAQNAAETDARLAYAANVDAQKSKEFADRDRQRQIDSALSDIRNGYGNQYNGPAQIAAARQELATITGQQQLGQMADKIANERYQIDQGLAGQKIAAGAHIATAQINHENDLAKAQAAGQIAMAKEQQKSTHDILTNGYGVAPTPQAIAAYQKHQANLTAWDKDVTTKLNALNGTYKPEEIAQIKSSLMAYNKNPKDKEAIKGIERSRQILTGSGLMRKGGAEPDWFVRAQQMPRFDTSNMQQWKQPQPVLGA